VSLKRYCDKCGKEITADQFYTRVVVQSKTGTPYKQDYCEPECSRNLLTILSFTRAQVEKLGEDLASYQIYGPLMAHTRIRDD